MSAGAAEEVDGPGHVEKGFVDRDPLHPRSEIAKDVDDLVAQALILMELSADEAQAGAEAARPPARHSGLNPEGSGLVGRRQHHTTADRNRQTPQGRIEQLLDGRIERIEVGVQDGGSSARRHVRLA